MARFVLAIIMVAATCNGCFFSSQSSETANFTKSNENRETTRPDHTTSFQGNFIALVTIAGEHKYFY